MALKKKYFAEGQIPIFEEACIYRQGEYWQFGMWLPKEKQYARKSLRSRSEATAVEKVKAACLEIYENLQQGKSYFSITTKEGLEKYLSFGKRDVELGHIVKGRRATIATHLQHFLSFIAITLMKLVVRAVKVDAVKLQLLSLLELGAEDITAGPTIYSGITLLNLDESAVSTLSSIRNIEALLLDEAAAVELLQPTTASEAHSFKSLDGVDELEQYEHLSQLLHIQKSVRDKR